MNTQSNTMAESFDTQRTAPATISASRTFYWSVRRELWENRSIYLAPLAVAAFFCSASSSASFTCPTRCEACRRSTQHNSTIPFYRRTSSRAD